MVVFIVVEAVALVSITYSYPSPAEVLSMYQVMAALVSVMLPAESMDGSVQAGSVVNDVVIQKEKLPTGSQLSRTCA